MSPSRLEIDTSLKGNGPSSKSLTSPTSANSRHLYHSNTRGRMRSTSNASTSSSLSIVSPTSSSTNGSSSCLHLPNDGTSSPRSNTLSSPTSSFFDDHARLDPEYVLAMHDYSPQQQGATCLSFRAGQVIHVLNRDTSGWWDGELEGRRGWFPSNYVNTDVNSLTDEELPEMPDHQFGHTRSMSDDSTTSWTSTQSLVENGLPRLSRGPETIGSDVDVYCPSLMVPLLHGLALLQSAARAKRITHFQPSTACVISCVRSVLSATDCLPREAALLQRFPVLAQERKRILQVLASLVGQAKKASEDADEAEHDYQVELMLTLGGEVFSNVRRFLSVAAQCGVELPERRQSIETASISTLVESQTWSGGDPDLSTIPYSIGGTPPRQSEIIATTGSTLRIKSMGDLTQRHSGSTDDEWDPSSPLLPNRTIGPAPSKEAQYTLRQRIHGKGHKPAMLSISTTYSSSSMSSFDSMATPAMPPFPSGPSTTSQVMEALRFTHDQYLSTIAAFIGHAHSHSRSSHASSTGHLYDLVREIVEMACKLLTIVEAVMRHPEMPMHKLGNLKSAKEGLYNVTTSLADSVRLLTGSLAPTMSEEEEKQGLLRSATSALKAGADCVAAVKMCLNRSNGELPYVIHLPKTGETGDDMFESTITGRKLGRSNRAGGLSELYNFSGADDDEDLTVQVQTPSTIKTQTVVSPGSDQSNERQPLSLSPRDTSPKEDSTYTSSSTLHSPAESELPLRSFSGTETTWEGSQRRDSDASQDEKILNGELPSVTLDAVRDPIPQDPEAWIRQHDFPPDEVAYNSEGNLVGATMEVLVEKMTPHDRIVDPAFSAVFFLTFRLFSSATELVQAIIARYNLMPPPALSLEQSQDWQKHKGIPVRLRVSNFIKLWLEMYWRSADAVALPLLASFTREGLGIIFPGPSQRILELIEIRETSADVTVSQRGDRIRDPGMSINPPAPMVPSEIPRPSMTKTLLAALRNKNFASITITDFDSLELARQLTIMECKLYCAIQPEEVLETGQEGAKPPVNVRAMSTLSTVITGWVAESILNEHDAKKRTLLVKFFIKVADRCASLHNFSTSRSILAALDSSTISRLHQTWMGLPQKNRTQLDALRRLADHSRNYHEYRSRLRNTAPPAVPFLGLYLTDVTFCREGNPSHRASPVTPSKKLINFNKYHKLARIVQDMQRFQMPYNLKSIPEVQAYLNVAFDNAKHHGDLQDLYRRSLLVEPRLPADPTPTSEMRQLFNWATRSQSQVQPTAT